MNERGQLRTFVRGAYDIQKLRISMGNRIVGNFKAKLGQKPSAKEDTLDAEGKRLLRDLRAHYRKLTDGVVEFPREAEFEGDELISTYTELCLVAQYESLAKSEAEHFTRLESVLAGFPIYTHYLRDVRGVGAAMAGVILSEFDIHKAPTVSAMWKYAGLAVMPDGRGQSRRTEHLVEWEYRDKDGKPATRLGITFNPWLKTKLVGVLATSFLRSKSPWAEVYKDCKHRLESHAQYGVQNDKIKDGDGRKITSKLRRHNMAIRYMVKMFLIDLHKQWREIEGLPVRPPYHEEKLGHQHTACG